MNSEFIGRADLSNLIDWLAPIRRTTNWLFVVLDSVRDNFAEIDTHSSPQMRQQGISFWWRPEGLWFPGSELAKSFVTRKIVVPFSACYIFDKCFTECPKPKFTATTDAGHQFPDSEIANAAAEIMRIKALAYASDGSGLQLIVVNDRLISALSKIPAKKVNYVL